MINAFAAPFKGAPPPMGPVGPDYTGDTGRRILYGFSFLQRIGKAATTDFWMPPETRSFADSVRVVPDWAAVRQYEILRDAPNLAIYDLEVDNLNRSFTYLMKMRGGGYRLTVITLGTYTPDTPHDAQSALDVKLRDEIAQLINMLYLEEPSRILSGAQKETLAQGQWNITNALPHVALTLGAADLFRKKKAATLRALEKFFFARLAALPQNHMTHDVAVGLSLPELNDQRHWTYIPRKEEQYFLFQKALTDVFEAANWLSLEGLQTGKTGLHDEMPVMRHMTGHGLRLTPHAAAEQRALAAYAKGYGDVALAA